MAYCGTRREVSAGLNRICARWEIAKWRLKYEARKRGWRSQIDSRPWTTEEVAQLKEKLDCVPITRIARDLKRSVLSAQVMAKQVRLLARVTEGYGISDLAECFGLRQARVEGWARRGLLGRKQQLAAEGGDIRFTPRAVARFIRRCPHEYDLRRLNQEWFKAVVFDLQTPAGISGSGGDGEKARER